MFILDLFFIVGTCDECRRCQIKPLMCRLHSGFAFYMILCKMYLFCKPHSCVGQTTFIGWLFHNI